MRRNFYWLSATVSTLSLVIPNLYLKTAITHTANSSQRPSDRTLAQSSDRILPKEFYGTWKGEIAQPGFGNYTMTLTLHKCQIGQRCGEYVLPSLKCSGYMTYIRNDRNAYVMKGHLEQGSGRCLDGLINTFTLNSPNVLTRTWKQEDGGNQVGQGTLSKVPSDTPLRYLAINVGNADLSCASSEYKLCRADVVERLRNYIASWKPDVIMFSEIKRAAQLTGTVDGGPVLPEGYDGVCGVSYDRYTRQPTAWNAKNASHEHECIAWKTSRITPVAGARQSLRTKLPVDSLSAYGRNDYEKSDCDFDFTGFRAKLLLENKIPITAVAVHPDSMNTSCRTEEIARYWTTLANKRNVIIGGDWNTESVENEIKLPPNFKVNYSLGQHWDITTHQNEYTAVYGNPDFVTQVKQLDHAFSNFGQPCTDCGGFYSTPNLTFGSALGGYDNHPRADGGSGMDHRQILVDMLIPADVTNAN